MRTMHLKNLTCIAFLLYLELTFGLTSTTQRANDDHVCCVEGAFDTHLFLDSGVVIIADQSAYAFINSTFHTAYSFTSQKLFYNISFIEQSPLFKPFSVNKTILMDYNLGISYSVIDGHCQKDQISSSMPKLCIPNDAQLLSTGVFGRGSETRVLDTYMFDAVTDLKWNVTATVFRNRLTPIHPKMCVPYHIAAFSPDPQGFPDSGQLYTFDVMDFGPIKSHGIFDIPEACR